MIEPTQHPTSEISPANPGPMNHDYYRSPVPDPYFEAPYQVNDIHARTFTPDKSRARRCVSVHEFCETNKKFSFCCNGVIMIPPWVCFPMGITLPLVLGIPTGFWFGMRSMNLFTNLSTHLIILDILIVVITVVALFVTTFRDPGIIPRHALMPEDPQNGGIAFDEIGGLWKYCVTCHIWRPPRSKHCGQSDACIHVFDHHCPWVGNTIGARNYFSFCVFVASAMSGIILFSIQFLVLMKSKKPSEENSSNFMKYVFIVLIVIVASGLAWLCIENICNIQRNLTLNEARLDRFEFENQDESFCINMLSRFRSQPSQLLMNKKQASTSNSP